MAHLHIHSAYVYWVLAVLTLSLPSCPLKDLALWVIWDLCYCFLALTHHSLPFYGCFTQAHMEQSHSKKYFTQTLHPTPTSTHVFCCPSQPSISSLYAHNLSLFFQCGRNFKLLEYSDSYNIHLCNTITKIAKC